MIFMHDKLGNIRIYLRKNDRSESLDLIELV